MHILIAPNAFKNSLPAAEAARALEEGLQASDLDCTTLCFPVGDGGDGTASLIVQQHHGSTVRIPVHDPLNKKTVAAYALIDKENTAVIELSDASGIRLLKKEQLDPLRATTFGTGELILNALHRNVKKIILCIGGSATVDGGTGILRALGMRFLDRKNAELTNLPEDLFQLAAIDQTLLDQRIRNCELIILCDVDNRLLGKEGAAAIFGPQKGATAADVEKLEIGLGTLRDIGLKQTGKDMAAVKYGGAAGGVAASLAIFCNARLVSGIDYFLHINEFDRALNNTDLVITGEGSIDAQTLQGKGPYGVAVKAKEKKIPVIGVAGKIPSKVNAQLKKYFDFLLPINSPGYDMDTVLQHTRLSLVRAGKAIGNRLARNGFRL
jgi:glycerate 2-kinase